ncbi:MAG: PQQ-dependent sugar dehydrogenase [Bacteroidota bacterium]
MFKYYFILSLCFLLSCQAGKEAPGLPEANRFLVEDLITNLNEPMELDFMPDGKILFIERRGILKMYDPETEIVQVVGEIPVNYINENGLLGMAIDPNFKENDWIYFFYTDPIRKSYQQISRFEFINHQLVNESEKVLLDFYIDYKNCCHFGGSLAFGPAGNLFISSGDNVGGKDFAPIDERPGRAMHDSQRSSGNANDLRGAILRIKPTEDGSYSIPDGNLFPVGTANTRPEIYVMGARNPLKIDVDQATGWLYWGDVGPNPGWKYKEWGPPSFEEVNQAQKAGNYGWPYLMGDNQAFRDVNFETNIPGEFFDPNDLVNDSPNNTGIQQLPPAQKALIWYPNTASDSFPLVGTGGGTICAGPVYHYRENGNAGGQWPKHFDKKLFIFEWMRSWILAVELDESGAYVGMENPFEGKPFKKPIDIAFGPDGAMYVLDYGSNWYAHNEDARLSKIIYEYGNRAPIAKIEASVVEGVSPLEVHFSAASSYDLDQDDKLTYKWFFTSNTIQSDKQNPSHVFQDNGAFEVKLEVTDEAGVSHTTTQKIIVGNAPPVVQVNITDNQSFFVPHQDISYAIHVDDLEDGSTSDESIPSKAVQVKVKHLKNTTNVAAIRAENAIHSSTIEFLEGKKLMEGSDCKACHALNAASVGPSFVQISERYANNSSNISILSEKVLKGGVGVWGDKLMSAHPQHTKAEAKAMVSYILALKQAPSSGQDLPLSGIISTDKVGDKDLLILTSSYLDKGANEQAAISREVRKIFRPTLVPAVDYDYSKRIKAKPYNEQGDLYAEVALNGCFIGFKEIDLTGVKTIRVKIRSTSDWVAVEARQGRPDGKYLDKQRKELGFKENKWASYEEDDWFYIDLSVPENAGIDDLYFVFDSSKLTSEFIYYDICQVQSFEFLF